MVEVNKKSKRASDNKLTIEEARCPYCNHNKAFRGNPAGYNLRKCCRCKEEY